MKHQKLSKYMGKTFKKRALKKSQVKRKEIFLSVEKIKNATKKGLKGIKGS